MFDKRRNKWHFFLRPPSPTPVCSTVPLQSNHLLIYRNIYLLFLCHSNENKYIYTLTLVSCRSLEMTWLVDLEFLGGESSGLPQGVIVLSPCLP